MLSPASPLRFKDMHNMAGGALSWKLRPKQERHNQILLFGSQKHHVWKEITVVNSFSMDSG